MWEAFYPWSSSTQTATTNVSPGIVWMLPTTTASNPIAWISQTTSSAWAYHDQRQEIYQSQHALLYAAQVQPPSQSIYWQEPAPRFVPRVPAIIRPHRERQAEWIDRIRQEEAITNTDQARERRLSAVHRAHSLLLEHLTPEQRSTFERNNWFIVEGGQTKRQYRINGGRGLAGNVDVIGEQYRLCAHLDPALPMGDQLMAQKLMLEYDEDHFLRTANRHG